MCFETRPGDHEVAESSIHRWTINYITQQQKVPTFHHHSLNQIPILHPLIVILGSCWVVLVVALAWQLREHQRRMPRCPPPSPRRRRNRSPKYAWPSCWYQQKQHCSGDDDGDDDDDSSVVAARFCPPLLHFWCTPRTDCCRLWSVVQPWECFRARPRPPQRFGCRLLPACRTRAWRSCLVVPPPNSLFALTILDARRSQWPMWLPSWNQNQHYREDWPKEGWAWHRSLPGSETGCPQWCWIWSSKPPSWFPSCGCSGEAKGREAHLHHHWPQHFSAIPRLKQCCPQCEAPGSWRDRNGAWKEYSINGRERHERVHNVGEVF